MYEYDVTPVWDNTLDHDLHHLDDGYMDMDTDYENLYDLPEYDGSISQWDMEVTIDY